MNARGQQSGPEWGFVRSIVDKGNANSLRPEQHKTILLASTHSLHCIHANVRGDGARVTAAFTFPGFMMSLPTGDNPGCGKPVG